MRHSLLLDKNYVALSIVPWKRAVKLIVTGKAEAVTENNSSKVPYASGLFTIPPVLRLLVTVPWKAHINRLRFGRKNMLIRDKYRCQYCGSKVGKDASIDHIIPKSRGGRTDYFNCVTSCYKCNNAKADMTPEEAGMTLIRKPAKPTFLALHKFNVSEKTPEEWRDYLKDLEVADENNV
jgi:5-methylcytosine-specific restriction endonuclease McrA